MTVLERFSLEGRTAIVTGAGRAVEALGRRGLAIEVDVRERDQVEAMVDAVVESWGRLDIAVNNAGVARTAIG